MLREGRDLPEVVVHGPDLLVAGGQRVRIGSVYRPTSVGSAVEDCLPGTLDRRFAVDWAARSLVKLICDDGKMYD